MLFLCISVGSENLGFGGPENFLGGSENPLFGVLNLSSRGSGIGAGGSEDTLSVQGPGSQEAS